MSGTALPKSWTTLKLAEVGTWRGGGTPSKANPAFWTNGTIPWVSPKDMKQPRLSTAQDLITKSAVESSATNLIAEGSVLLVTRSGILAHSLPVAVNLVPVALNQDIKAVTPHPITDAEYLRLIFQCFERDILNTCRKGGTTVHSIEFPALQDFTIPLPPVPEQKRIVAKIEELFSELEAGEESLRVARRQLGVYRQSLLQQAFEGKLTAQWRTQNRDKLESPAQLLTRIQSARQSRYEEELKEWSRELKQWENSSRAEKRPAKPRKPQDVKLPTSDQVENLSELPKAWAWISVANCAVEISDGPFGSNLKSDDYVGSGVRVVRLENIGPGIFIEEKKSFISPEKYQKLKRHTVRPGDIVVASFINDAVRAALIPPSIEYAVNKADCFQVHCFGDTISADFLVRCFGARYFFKQLEQLIHGVGRPRINTTQLGEAFVPLCSLPEQQEIVRVLDEQFEGIGRNEREIDGALRSSAALRQAILQKAFTGRLVPQDASDEPASVLLARLRAQKMAVTTAHRTPRKAAGDDWFPEIAGTRRKPKRTRKTRRPGTTDLQAGIVALAIDRFGRRRQFLGHTNAEKVVHLADGLADLQLDREPVKDAAGPNDFPRVKEVEHRAHMKHWFTAIQRGEVWLYQPGRNLPALLETTRRKLGPKLLVIDRLLETLRGLDTRQIEVRATVYAAWNNLLLRRVAVSDEAIVTEARENWHERKLEIDRPLFFEAIGWLREHGFMPRGTGRLVDKPRTG